ELRVVSTRALVELDRSFYSVPHVLVGQRVRVRVAVDATTLEVHAAEGIVATHRLAEQPGSIVWDRTHRDAIDRELTGRPRPRPPPAPRRARAGPPPPGRGRPGADRPSPTPAARRARTAAGPGPAGVAADRVARRGLRHRPDRSCRPLPAGPERGRVMATTR